MSDARAFVLKGRGPGLGLRRLAALAVTLVAASALAQGTPAARPAAATPAVATPGKGEAKPAPVPKPKAPRQMAEELVPLLSKQKTPWQLYPTYQQIFTEFAEKEASLVVAGSPNDPHAKLAKHLQAMAGLLTAMGDQAKLRDDIKRGRSALPPEDRQNSFVAAGTEHVRLLAEFARLGALLPQARPQPVPGTPAPATR